MATWNGKLQFLTDKWTQGAKGKGLPADAIVEVPGIISGLGIQGLSVPPLPAGIAELYPGGDPTATLEEADRRMFAEKRGR